MASYESAFLSEVDGKAGWLVAKQDACRSAGSERSPAPPPPRRRNNAPGVVHQMNPSLICMPEAVNVGVPLRTIPATHSDVEPAAASSTSPTAVFV